MEPIPNDVEYSFSLDKQLFEEWHAKCDKTWKRHLLLIDPDSGALTVAIWNNISWYIIMWSSETDINWIYEISLAEISSEQGKIKRHLSSIKTMFYNFKTKESYLSFNYDWKKVWFKNWTLQKWKRQDKLWEYYLLSCWVNTQTNVFWNELDKQEKDKLSSWVTLFYWDNWILEWKYILDEGWKEIYPIDEELFWYYIFFNKNENYYWFYSISDNKINKQDIQTNDWWILIWLLWYPNEWGRVKARVSYSGNIQEVFLDLKMVDWKLIVVWTNQIEWPKETLNLRGEQNWEVLSQDKGLFWNEYEVMVEWWYDYQREQNWELKYWVRRVWSTDVKMLTFNWREVVKELSWIWSSKTLWWKRIQVMKINWVKYFSFNEVWDDWEIKIIKWSWDSINEINMLDTRISFLELWGWESMIYHPEHWLFSVQISDDWEWFELTSSKVLLEDKLGSWEDIELHFEYLNLIMNNTNWTLFLQLNRKIHKSLINDNYWARILKEWDSVNNFQLRYKIKDWNLVLIDFVKTNTWTIISRLDKIPDYDKLYTAEFHGDNTRSEKFVYVRENWEIIEIPWLIKVSWEYYVLQNDWSLISVFDFLKPSGEVKTLTKRLL